MKLDLAKLPVLEAVIGFLLLAIAVTFIAAFIATESPGEETAATDGATPAGTPTGGVTGSPDTFAVTMEDNKFAADEITVPAGALITFNITNEGRALHNLHIEGEGGAYTEDFCEGQDDPCSDPNSIKGGGTGALEWQTPASPAELDFRCDFHPAQMTGKINVE